MGWHLVSQNMEEHKTNVVQNRCWGDKSWT